MMSQNTNESQVEESEYKELITAYGNLGLTVAEICTRLTQLASTMADTKMHENGHVGSLVISLHEGRKFTTKPYEFRLPTLTYGNGIEHYVHTVLTQIPLHQFVENLGRPLTYKEDFTDATPLTHNIAGATTIVSEVENGAFVSLLEKGDPEKATSTLLDMAKALSENDSPTYP